MSLVKEDLDDLKYAKKLLEKPSLAAKISNLLGTPIEKGFERLPEKWRDIVYKATEKSLEKALFIAIQSMHDRKPTPSSDKAHKFLVFATGAGGGTFGLPALAVELPVTTAIMLRSIADIARSEGEQISSLETRLACMEVFALGGSSKKDDGTETGYYFVRATMARAVSEAAQYIVEKGLSREGAPVLVKLITALASRFGVTVTEKVAAQSVPLIGAAGGALINTVFIDHFQNMARGHFIVRRLERVYGAGVVKQQFNQLE